MTNVEAATTRGIDPTTGPYMRDGSSNHTHYYTFTFSSGLPSFDLQPQSPCECQWQPYVDLNPGQFVVSTWNKG